MRRPWNISNSSVYSLLTFGEHPNFNICTYVTAVSMKPKVYAIGIDYSSQTYLNLKQNAKAVLHILSDKQKPLIRILGKKSGKNFDKMTYLRKKQVLSNWNENPVLKESSALMELSLFESVNFKADHELFLFKVSKSKTINEKQVLDFQTLIKEKIIL